MMTNFSRIISQLSDPLKVIVKRQQLIQLSAICRVPFPIPNSEKSKNVRVINESRTKLSSSRSNNCPSQGNGSLSHQNQLKTRQCSVMNTYVSAAGIGIRSNAPSGSFRIMVSRKLDSREGRRLSCVPQNRDKGQEESWINRCGKECFMSFRQLA